MPAEPVVFADTELWTVEYLQAELPLRPEPYTADVWVGNVLPAPRRNRMVAVRRDGGPDLPAFRETARQGVNVWGTTEQEATDLARVVRALIKACPYTDPLVVAATTTGPSPVADESEQPRRYFTVELTFRAP